MTPVLFSPFTRAELSTGAAHTCCWLLYEEEKPRQIDQRAEFVGARSSVTTVSPLPSLFVAVVHSRVETRMIHSLHWGGGCNVNYRTVTITSPDRTLPSNQVRHDGGDVRRVLQR